MLGVDLDEDDDEEDDDYREQLAHIRKQKFEEELGSDLEQDDADSEGRNNANKYCTFSITFINF